MSRWRCGSCLYIIDNRTWYKYPVCPNCGEENPDDKWIDLSHEKCERLYEEQQKEWNEQLEKYRNGKSTSN